MTRNLITRRLDAWRAFLAYSAGVTEGLKRNAGPGFRSAEVEHAARAFGLDPT
jgi:hypothetical protein